jgi:SAM-dependent methyltransferase
MGTEKSSKWYNSIFERSSIDKNSIYAKEPENTHYYPVWQKVIEIIKEKDYRAVLDIGCGPGHFGKLCLKNKIGYLGWDFSETAIRMAKKLNKGDEYRFRVCKDVTTMDNITFPAVVTMTEVLEHITKDIPLLNRIFCKLLIITLPSYDYISHVRYFKKEQDIISRYGDVVPIENIYPIMVGSSNIIYVVVVDYEKLRKNI